MKYTQLPVLGERNWLEHVNKSFQEVGGMVQLSDRSDPTYLDGASEASDNQMYVWRTILNDGAGHQRTIIGGAGNVHHPAIKMGGHFTIKAPWEIGRGAQISGNIFDMTHWKVEVGSDGSVQFTPMQDVSEGTHWFDFRMEWPF